MNEPHMSSDPNNESAAHDATNKRDDKHATDDAQNTRSTNLIGSEARKLDATFSQRINRAANQDWLRVLGMIGGAFPMAAGSDSVNLHFNTSSMSGTSSTSDDYGLGVESDGVINQNQRSTDVEERERLRVRMVYVPHLGFEGCLDRLRQTRCVALRGLAGLGKRAMAIALANAVGSSNDMGAALIIRELEPGGNWVDEIKTADVPPHSFFLAEGVLRRTGQMLKPEYTYALLRLLAEKRCYLVICAQTNVPFPREIRVTQVETLSPEDCAQVLKKHLQYYNIAKPDDVIAHPTITKILQQGLPLAQADYLASAIADGLAENRSIDECLAQFEENTSELARDWIEEAAREGVAELSLRLSLAAFSGVQHPDLQQIAAALKRALHPEKAKPKNEKENKEENEENEEKDKPTAKPFTVNRISAKLEHAQAWRRKRAVPTPYSDMTQIEVLELKNERLCEPALLYAWREFDLGTPLLNWLSRFALNGERDVRTRAATMMGALAAANFHEIFNSVLQGWAQVETRDEAERERHHEALGYALGALMAKGVHQNDVLGLLNFWAGSNNQLLRCAAARAFSRVALWRPQDAMTAWRDIVESVGKISLEFKYENYRWYLDLRHPLHMAVIESALAFFHCAAEYPYRLRPILERALEGLKHWVEQDMKDRKAEQVGLLLFTLLMQVKEPPEGNGGDVDDWPPALFQVASEQTDEKYCVIVCELMRRGMDRRDVGFAVADILRDWIMSAEKNGKREDIMRLLQVLIDLPDYSKRERNRLSMYLQRWSKHPTQPVRLAEELLQDLRWK